MAVENTVMKSSPDNSGTYILLDAKQTIDKDSNMPILRVTVGVPPQMVRVSVKVADIDFPLTQEQVRARCEAVNFIRVRLENFAISKAWPGFGGNNDGFAFCASKAIPL